MKKKHFFYSLSVILLLIVAVAGWFATDYLGNKARQEIIRESRASVGTLSIHLSSTLNKLQGAVKSLAGSPWIAPALLSKGAMDIEHANSVLDRYNSALSASVSYLMDADGMTVASSNRNDPDSFVGKSYSFRPYFQEAAKGRPDRYFALGVTSGKRGFYASYPVRNHTGKVVGVVTMKKNLDEMETFFCRYVSSCYLVSPDGVIFLSSSPTMVLKSLWPLDKTVQDTLIASQQFGNKPFEAGFFKKEIADGTEVALEGRDYFVSRTVIDSDGWSLVLLTSTDRVGIYKLIGILATIFVGTLIMVFSCIIFVIHKSKEAIRQSEDSKRRLLHAIGTGILGVDTAGTVTFVNASALRMLGFAEEEMLHKNLHVLIHHSREDGSDYPVEDCPMHASYTKAVENTVSDEVLWRKDGSCFPVDYSSMPITVDGTILGAVVTFRNITEQKLAEEALQESENRYYSLFNYAVDGMAVGNAETGELTDCNQALCRMVERDRTELIGQHQSILHPENHLENGLSTSFRLHKAGDKVQVLEDRLVSKSGKIIPVEINATKIRIRGHEHLLGIFRDITERKLAEEALQEITEKQKLERDRLDLILRTAQDGFWLVDASTGRLIDVNDAACSMLGYTREELLKLGLAETYAQWSLEELGREIQKVKLSGNALFETRQRAKSGQIIDVEVSVNYLPATDQFFSFIHDITKRKKTEGGLKQSIERFRDLVETTSDMIWEMDQNGVYTYVNMKIKDLLGYDPGEVIGRKTPFDLMLPDERMRLEETFSDIVKNRKAFANLENWNLHKDGRKVLLETGGIPFFDAEGQYVGYRGIDRDITERKQAEEKIQEMAYHDSLTGLPNRKLFSDRLRIVLAQARRNQKKVGIAMLDLDNFKDVNDTLGHDVGDLLLKATAERLSAALRKGDTVARFGGDEFLLILPELERIEDTIQVAQKIVDIFCKPFLIDTHQLIVTTSIGIAVYPNDGIGEGILLKNADIAMYEAKHAGRNRYQLYKKA